MRKKKVVEKTCDSWKYPKTTKLLKKLLPYWNRYQKIKELNSDVLDEAKEKLNKEMQKATGIKDIQIWKCEFGEGIANKPRTMELIQDIEFKDRKIWL